MSAYEHLLDRAGEAVARRKAGACQVRCPAHDDQQASLAVSDGKGEGAVVYCHAGCETADVLAAWDLPLGALFDSYWTSNGSRRDEPLETYDYVDESGQLLYRVHRFPGKRFAQQAADGSWKVTGIRRVPYRLPKLLAAIERDETVWIVEGEKDVHALEDLGFTATTCAAGAGKWRDEFAEHFTGAKVVAIGDCDGTGREHVRKVEASLGSAASALRVVDLDRARDDGYDVSDLIRDVGRAEAHERLERLADQAGEPDPPVEEPEDVTSVGRIRRALFTDSVGTASGDDVARVEVPGTGGLLYRAVPHSFYGDRGEGKTVTTLIVTLSAAAAGERVLVLDRENGASLTRSLVKGILEAHHDWPDVLADERWVGRHYPTFDAGWQPADYAEAIAGLAYTGVVYDSVREVVSELGGNPNDDQDISTLQRILVTPLIRRGLWVVLLDNVGHLEKGRPKGAGAKLDAVPQGYQVRTVAEFGPDKLGQVEVKCLRSRYGDLGREWSLRVGKGTFDVPSSRAESPDQRAARELAERFERFAQDVIDVLSQEAPLGRKHLLGGVKGARLQTKRDWLDRLVSEGQHGVLHDPESGYFLDPAQGGSQGGGLRPLIEGRTHPPDPGRETETNTASATADGQEAP